MEPDRTPSGEDLTTAEDDRSQNTKIAHQLENGIEEVNNEAQEHFDVERHLEDNTREYNIVDAVDTGLMEDGLPNEPQNKIGQVRDFLVDQLGYDPDVEDYATFGDVEVLYGDRFIDVFYEVGENLSSPEGLTAPLIHDADPEILEYALAGDVPHAATTSYERDGKNGVQFRYREEDWIMATEEVGDAISGFEEELEFSSYSGR